ncbi:MAG: hypothetical protein GXP27_15340, partial [Planctomycetes bacterium]|nr:hypothetical protein [Planctomycetota bacterium]
IAMDAALQRAEVIGQTAVATAEVPNAAYCRWRRTVAQRIGRYALIADDLTFRTDADNMEVQLLWETPTAPHRIGEGRVEFRAPIDVPERRLARGGQIHASDPIEAKREGRITTMQWLGPVRSGERRVFFSLVGIEPDAKQPSLGCLRLGPCAAVLKTPEPAVAVAGAFETVAAELSVLSQRHLFAIGLESIGVGSGTARQQLLASSSPITVDWDFGTGTLHLVAPTRTEVSLPCENPAALRLNGKVIEKRHAPSEGTTVITLSAGRHVLTGASPPPSVTDRLARWLDEQVDRAERRRNAERTALKAERSEAPFAHLPELKPAFTVELGERVVDVAAVNDQDGRRIYAAAGKTVYRILPSGRIVQKLECDGPIRVIRWWPEHRLLLAGCVDEKVIAFGPDGERRWVFISQMHPAVYRAAKTYWFKSAPG